MKKSEIRPVLNALKTIDVAKIEDASLRESIVASYVKLVGEQRSYAFAIDSVTELFLSKYADEQNEVLRLQQSLRSAMDANEKDSIVKEIESHRDYLAAVRESNDRIRAIGNEEVDAQRIDGNKFVSAISKMEKFDLGIIETLYPILSYGS